MRKLGQELGLKVVLHVLVVSRDVDFETTKGSGGTNLESSTVELRSVPIELDNLQTWSVGGTASCTGYRSTFLKKVEMKMRVRKKE